LRLWARLSSRCRRGGNAAVVEPRAASADMPEFLVAAIPWAVRWALAASQGFNAVVCIS
jgi:hypothetical protein